MHNKSPISEIPLERNQKEVPSYTKKKDQKTEVLLEKSKLKKSSRTKKKPKIGTCCSLTTACVDDVPGTNCILNQCCKSRGFNSCLECSHWANPSDPCQLEKVSRNYCPAVLNLALGRSL